MLVLNNYLKKSFLQQSFNLETVSKQKKNVHASVDNRVPLRLMSISTLLLKN